MYCIATVKIIIALSVLPSFMFFGANIISYAFNIMLAMKNVLIDALNGICQAS